MTTKFKLIPDPTFKATVSIPRPGLDPAAVEFTSNHQPRAESGALTASRTTMDDASYVMSIASGWELKEKWTRDNVSTLLNNFHGAAKAIAASYIAELTGTKIAE